MFARKASDIHFSDPRTSSIYYYSGRTQDVLIRIEDELFHTDAHVEMRSDEMIEWFGFRFVVYREKCCVQSRFYRLFPRKWHVS